MLFQGMFFIITPALICGAFAERMKFSTMVVFMILWGTLVYCPLCHWVWGGGILAYGSEHAKQYCAGGALGFRRRNGRAHQLGRLGPGLRAGAGQAAGLRQRADAAAQPDLHRHRRRACCGSAGSASTPAAHWRPTAWPPAPSAPRTSPPPPAALAWAGMEWIIRGKPSVLGACSGAVAGLVCITPAAGYVHADAGPGDGRRRRRRLLPGLHDAQVASSATTIRSTPSAFTASAERWARS